MSQRSEEQRDFRSGWERSGSRVRENRARQKRTARGSRGAQGQCCRWHNRSTLLAFARASGQRNNASQRNSSDRLAAFWPPRLTSRSIPDRASRSLDPPLRKLFALILFSVAGSARCPLTLRASSFPRVVWLRFNALPRAVWRIEGCRHGGEWSSPFGLLLHWCCDKRRGRRKWKCALELGEAWNFHQRKSFQHNETRKLLFVYFIIAKNHSRLQKYTVSYL